MHDRLEVSDSATRLLACGALAGPMFVAVFTTIGHKRSGYEPRRHSVSSLALGPGGAVQRANFVLAGSLYLAGSVGLARAGRSRFPAAPFPAMVAAAGIGLVGSGVFSTDPVSGYPPETPPQRIPPSRVGTWHTVFAIPIFLGIPAAALLSAGASLRNRKTAWAAYSAGTALVMPAAAMLAGEGFAQKPSLVRSGGLLQRVSIASGLGWLTALHIAVSRAHPGYYGRSR